MRRISCVSFARIMSRMTLDGKIDAGMGLGQRLQGFGLAANQQQVGTVAQQFGDQCLANPTTGPGDHGAAFRNIHR